MLPQQPGDLFAERFLIERLAGRGGMGSVFRALDKQTGNPVALKFLHASAQAHRLRFIREAQLLAELQHPGIVRYVAHGESSEGELFLAMEWLEGVDVGGRLHREGLAPSESLRLARAVAEVLNLAHEHGVIHRDIKPTNLFLCDNDPTRLKVLDFGVARLSGAVGPSSTQTGAMLGTPGYMAPEQARGLREIDARADLFSLGCVLFECLTGWAPFAAEHDVAVLAKILLDEPPRLSTHRPDLAGPVEDLVASLLAKNPDKRPPSARELVQRIDALGTLRAHTAVGGTARPAEALTGGERRLFSVVLAGEAAVISGDGAATLQASVAEVTAAPTGLEQTSVRSAETGARLLALRRAAEKLGGALEPLGRDTFVVSLSGEGVATDQAERAARCALAVRSELPELAIAVATGRGEAAGRFPVGEVIDRAAALLRAVPPVDLATRGQARPVHLDALTSGLLGADFEWLAAPTGGWLHSSSGRTGAARTLLGKPTPCVGRERELSRLLGSVEESIEEKSARAVLVTAPPGVGKSRLRDELLRALAVRMPEVVVWTGRADPMRAGSPFHLLGQIVRQAAGISAEDAPEERQRKLRERVTGCLEAAERARVTPFLGELAGVAFDDGGDVQLRAARRDAQLMGDQTRRAFEDWLAAEVALHPVLLILDDLHWGDLPTVKLMDAALRRLAGAPLTVLALARPAVHELFPRIWSERGLEEMRLRELPKRAAEQLVRATLGDSVDAAQVERLVAQAEGNAFFLEELIRAAASGQREGLPDTVLAMVQTRLEALDPLSRRILRAASIFGRLFWKGGVISLCGGRAEASEVAAGLDALVEREVLERLGAVRFAGEEAFSFRHALLQEAAQAMLTDSDRALGHRLAAAWLLTKDEPDPLVMAEHLDQGGDPGRAMQLYARAAEDALRANDLAAAVERAEKAARCGASGEALGELRLLQSEANQWRGEQEEALRCAEAALPLLARGSETWCRAALELATCLSRKGAATRLVAIGAEVIALAANPPDPRALVICSGQMGWPLLITGQSARAHDLLDAAERVSKTITLSDARLKAALHYAGATRAQFAGDVEDWIWNEAGSVNAHLSLGDVRRACESRTSLGYALSTIGAHEEAERVLREALSEAIKLGLANIQGTALQNLGAVLAALGGLDEARGMLSESISIFERVGNQRMWAGSFIYLATVDLKRGEIELALTEASRAVSETAERPALRGAALAARAEIRLARGEVAEARADGMEAGAILEREVEVEEHEALIRLIDAETAWRTGQQDMARAILRKAVARLDTRAARIADPRRREEFEKMVEHQRTRVLARALGLTR